VPSASLVRTPFKVAAATGLACQAVAAATGLGAVIVRVQALFKAIKWAGIAYCRLIQALTL
jgi:threonine/homoserine/homoserine lactone efflux protein